MLALPLLPKGPLLLLVLLFGGAGALGMFPLYHAFTQDISGKHQGKITGIAGVTAWFLVPPAQKLFGRVVDVTGSYDIGLAAAACLPAVAAIVLWVFWGETADEQASLARLIAVTSWRVRVPPRWPAVAMAASAGVGFSSGARLSRAADVTATRMPKVAFLGTVVRKHSHAQHFLDRHTLGYSWQGGWQSPRLQVESVYIDQFPDDDLARSRAKRHGLRLYPTIEEALTLGGEKLAVDGVILIGEHGEYPTKRKGAEAISTLRVVQKDRQSI